MEILNHPEFKDREWDGTESLVNASLLVFGEQGIGDEIMFASCLADLQKIADTFVCAIDHRLIPLFQRSYPRITFLPRRDLSGLIQQDSLRNTTYLLAMGSLLKHFRTTLHSFSRQSAYLKADSNDLRMWQNRLLQLGRAPKVGFSWFGGANRAMQLVRATSLMQWAGLLQTSCVHWINLQYGDHRQEIEATEQTLGVKIHSFPEIDPLKDMDSFAALISSLDLVISVDNSTVHLAGALGVPTWVLLPFVPDWRWSLARDDSPWYASVRLFRQSRRGEWNDVFANLKSALSQLMRER